MNAALEIEREKAKALAQKMREEALQSAADESEKKVSAAAAKKKKTGASSALQKKLVAQREAAEAQKKAEEEEQKRIVDEEAKQAEEERLKEEARQKKKEKAKAKREELRKDGKLLTKNKRNKSELLNSEESNFSNPATSRLRPFLRVRLQSTRLPHYSQSTKTRDLNLTTAHPLLHQPLLLLNYLFRNLLHQLL